MKNLPKWMTTVTPVSTILAAVLFVSLPFIGYFLGIVSVPQAATPVTTNSVVTTATPVTTTAVVTTTSTTTATTAHVPQIVQINYASGKFTTPATLNIYKNDTVLVTSDTSCIEFSSDVAKLGFLKVVGTSLIGKRNPQGEGICANNLGDPQQSFTMQYSDTGSHKLYAFGCLNTQCLSPNEEINSQLYVPVIINVQ